MVRNHIRARLADAEVHAKELAQQMPDNLTAVAMTYIVNGKVLPTKDGLQAMCATLQCAPEDLYELNDLDLLCEYRKLVPDSSELDVFVLPTDQPKSIPTPKRNSRNHEGMEEFRSWMKPEEKAALKKCVTALGYRSMSEWLRDMVKQTIKRYLDLHLAPKETVISRVLQSENQTI